MVGVSDAVVGIGDAAKEVSGASVLRRSGRAPVTVESDSAGVGTFVSVPVPDPRFAGTASGDVVPFDAVSAVT